MPEPAVTNPYQAPEAAVSLQPQIAQVSLAPTQPPRVWTAFLAFVLAFAATIVFQIILVIVLILPQLQSGNTAIDQQELLSKFTDPGMFLFTLLLSQLLIGLAGIVPAIFSNEGLALRLGFVSPNVGPGEFAALAVSVLFPTAIGMGLAHVVALVIPPDQSLVGLFGKLTVAWAVAFVLCIALAPGFMEEALFRGYIQRRLLQRWHPATAILVTSVLFSLMHIMPHVVVATFPISIWLGIIAWKTKSIWPTVAAHALLNGSWNILNLSMKFEVIPKLSAWVTLPVMALIGLCFFAISLRILFRAEPAVTSPRES